jgi:hypothetical protein
MHTIESTIIDRIGSGVVNASPDDCITVGTGGRLVPWVGVEVEIPSASPSLRLDNGEFEDLRRPPRETRPSIRRMVLCSEELEEPTGGEGVTGSCMPKARTGSRALGLAIY